MGGPEEEHARRLLAGEAWRDFCRSLEAAGRHVLAPGTPDSPRERAAGYRYLAGLAVSGLRQALDFARPEHPRFLRNPDSSAKWGAENADNQYLWARIRSDRRYRIRGRRESAYDFLVEVKEGYLQLGEARNFATLCARDLTCEPDGSFEIVLSAEREPGNWLPLHPDARYVAIRQYFWDWEHEVPARFEIADLGSEGEAPAPLEPAEVAQLLDGAAAWVEASARVWNRWVAELRAAHRPGEIAAARPYAGGADDIRYGNDVYRLAEDEALLLTSAVPRARYWGFQLCDLWFQSLDYANRQTSLNGHQARVDGDGRVRVVVARRDPGVPNWLDATGHPEGMIQYRWIWTEDEPRPTARVLKLSALAEALPADTPRVDAEERRRAIRVRQQHVRRREPAS